ncbi:AAA family ATPase [Streptomyces sp. NPDC016845]|uniref:AAA family ATPase n=1 Tax=Streptomyces sp. NPDC016845 TaxID=3364972 RepID=UPI0037BD8DBB
MVDGNRYVETAMADTDDRHLRAAVLSVFDLPWIEPTLSEADVDDATAFLSTSCERVLDPEGKPRWRMRDDERVRVLRTVPKAKLRAVLDSVTTRPDEPLQHLLEQYLHSGLPPAEDLGPAELSGLLQLERWFGSRAGIPAAQQVQSRLDWLNLLAPLQRLLARGFVGRKDLLARLTGFVQQPGTSGPFVIEGVGGSGKSTVLARLIPELARRGDIVAYINFDRAWLVDGGAWALVGEVARQAAVQRSNLGDGMIRVRRQVQRFASRTGYEDVASRSNQSVERVPRFVMTELSELMSPRRHLVIVIDTLEELARRETSLAVALSGALGELATVLPDLRIIAAGRARPRYGFETAEIWHLTGLGDADALHLLRLLTADTGADHAAAPDARPHPEVLLPQITRVLGGNPLSLQLAADVLNRTGNDPTRIIAIGEGDVQGQLYSRLLEHIRDPRVRAIAHPGLTVRRLTPDIIRRVLAKPCGISPLSEAEAEAVFWALTTEATLCEKSVDGDGALVHRPDVRALMLPSIKRDRPATTRQIHEAAVRYYEAIAPESAAPSSGFGVTERVARREELYHRLMLKQEPAELDRRWLSSVAEDLASVMDELPLRSQLYLVGRIRGLRLDPAVRAEADDEEWCHAVRPAVEARLERGLVEDALALLRERHGHDGRSLLADLEIEALERLGRVTEALALAERERARASSLGHDHWVRQMIGQQARILERMQRWGEAWALLEPLAVLDRERRGRTSMLDEEVRLRELVVLTSLLRIARHQGRTSEAIGQLAAETTDIAESTPARLLTGSPSLLRDLAAETGARSPKILQLATRVRGTDTDGSDTADGLDQMVPQEVFESEADKSLGYLGRPITDPTLGIAVDVAWRGEPRNRLVTIGDSLTHGFQSGAIFNTDLSYPAIIAYELGWAKHFRYPTYGGYGGLPFNIELLLRDLEERFGRDVDWWEAAPALFRARGFMDQVEDYWERGSGTARPRTTAIPHNLAVFGWDLRDALEKSADVCHKLIGTTKDHPLNRAVQNAVERAALRVLPTEPPEARALTQLSAAARLGEEVGDTDPAHGIETLIVFLGADNALKAVTQLRVVWSAEGYDDPERKKAYTVWQPAHFAAELRKVAAQVREIKARHVVWCTVPHVTIAPLARGVGGKTGPGSPYFRYYTRPWINDQDFDPVCDPHLTADQARNIDSAIDQYNDTISAVVRHAREAGKDWYLLDTAGLMDRLASRRYAEDLKARPPWWQPYPLPPELQSLTPLPNSHFLTSDGERRTDGGLFSLDGVHPTTVAYGILAQELINVMRLAGVTFRRPDGLTPRQGPVLVDFQRLVRRDTLINRPPGNLTASLHVIGWADEVLDLLRRTLSFDSYR